MLALCILLHLIATEICGQLFWKRPGQKSKEVKTLLEKEDIWKVPIEHFLVHLNSFMNLKIEMN